MGIKPSVTGSGAHVANHHSAYCLSHCMEQNLKLKTQTLLYYTKNDAEKMGEWEGELGGDLRKEWAMHTFTHSGERKTA